MSLGQLPIEGKLLSVYVDEGKIIDQDEVNVKCIEEISNGDELLEDFLRQLLSVDPTARPTAEMALNHAWLNS